MRYILIVLLSSLLSAEDNPWYVGKWQIDMPMTISYSFMNGGDKFRGNIPAIREIEKCSLEIDKVKITAYADGVLQGTEEYKIIGTDKSKVAVQTTNPKNGQTAITLWVNKREYLGLEQGETLTLWFKKVQ